jgi:hypothetical protein
MGLTNKGCTKGEIDFHLMQIRIILNASVTFAVFVDGLIDGQIGQIRTN